MNLLYLAIITICIDFTYFSIYAPALTQKQELKLIPDLIDNMVERGNNTTKQHKQTYTFKVLGKRSLEWGSGKIESCWLKFHYVINRPGVAGAS